jgi:membrane protein
MPKKSLVVLGAVGAATALRRAGSSRDDDPSASAEGVVDLTDDAVAPGPVASPEPAVPEGAARGLHATSPAEVPRRGWVEVGKRTLAEVKADRVPMMAAAVAFAGLLALFPAIIAAISIYGLVTDPASAAEAAGGLTSALPGDAASLITDQMRTVADAEPAALSTALVISILAALWSASGGVGMLVNALNLAYDEEDGRGFVKGRALALGLTLGAIAFLAVAVTLIAVVPAVIDGIGLGVVGTILAQVARWALLAVLITLALAALYRWAPDREDARWRWISPGAGVAAVLWLLASAAFSFFVANFAGVIVLMLWLQISALVVLVGAELNAELERQTAVDTTTGPPQPIGSRGAEPADALPPPAPAAASG